VAGARLEWSSDQLLQKIWNFFRRWVG